MKLAKKMILVTGGAGFIGTHLAERLSYRHRVVIFDNLRRNSLGGTAILKKHPHLEFIKGDVLDKKLLSKVMRGCHTVIHLAAIAGVSSYYKEPCETLRVNLFGTLNLLECCRDLKIKKVIDFSTSEVYGQDAFNVSEESNHCIGSLHDRRWSYAVSKLASEQLTIRYGEEYGFKAYSVRPFNIYGPRQTGEGAISNFFKAAVHKKPLVIYGDGAAVRAWCYISDCIDAVEALIEDRRLGSDTFNIGNPKEAYTTLALAKLVCQTVNSDTPIIFKNVKRTEIRVRIPNIDKAVKVLKFKPKISLLAGLRLTYQYYKGQS